MQFTRQSVQLLRRQFVNRQQARLSSSKQGFNKANLINIVGLPVCAALLFFVLPTFTPGEIHSLDWYDKKYLEETKEREAKRNAAGK